MAWLMYKKESQAMKQRLTPALSLILKEIVDHEKKAEQRVHAAIETLAKL